MECVIILNQSQIDFVPLHREILSPIEPIFVFDRFTPAELPPRYKIHIVDDDGFYAGQCRDVGAEGLDDDILFLDGDKLMSASPYETIRRLGDDNAVILFGCETDKREWIFSGERPPIGYYGNPHNGFCTCGIWLRQDFINDVREMNGGRIFHPIFDCLYGEEDRYLGDQCIALGYKAIGAGADVILSGKISGITSNRNREFNQNFANRIMLRSNIINPVAMDAVKWGVPVIRYPY